MTRRLSLENFDGAPRRAADPAPKPQAEPAASQPDVEALRAEAYEAGYNSGWDDSHAEAVRAQTSISSDLAQTLSDVRFTYEEARVDLLAAIRPVIETIIEQLLPRLAAEGLTASVAHELLPLIDTASDLRFELRAAPDVVPVVEKLITLRSDIDLRVQPEPTYSGAQVSLRMGSESRTIDLGDAVDKISAELRSFTDRLLNDTARPHSAGDNAG
ncbi:MAG: hypothetical protein AAF914_14460 [Pseudomonadota bacterium]